MTSSRRSPPWKISAVVSDVDGTLVTDDKTLTARAIAAVAELHTHGILFSIISSRPPRGVRGLIDSLTIATPVGCFNGGVIVKPDLSVISEHLLSPQVARRAVAMLDASGVGAWIFAGREWVTRDGHGAYTDLEERTIGFGPTIVKDLGPALDIAAKIVGVSADHEALARCERDTRGKLAGEATVARSQAYYLDITPPLANKGAGLLELSKLLAIPLAEIAVVGDGGNDVAMFEQAGFSIAMGNASAEVKRAADCVTDSNREDGFANAIERYILGGEHPSGRVERAPAGESAC